LVDEGVVKEYILLPGFVSESIDLATGITTYGTSEPATLKLNHSYDTGADYLPSLDFSILISNINHDKYKDVVLVYAGFREYYDASGYTYPSANKGYIVYLGSNTGLTNSNNYDNTVWSSKQSFKTFEIGDFNADGKLDLMGLIDNFSNTSNSTDICYTKGIDVFAARDWLTMISYGELVAKRIISADFNGDGRTDLLEQAQNSNWYMFTNTEELLATPTKYSVPSLHQASNIVIDERYDVYTLDYNGDGLSDIILGDETWDYTWNYFLGVPTTKNWFFDHTNWYFYKNTGGNFEQEGDPITSTDRIANLKGVIMDANGDGVQDLVLPRGNSYIALTKPNASMRNMVSSITNGMGLSQTFTYKCYSKINEGECIASLTNVKIPIMAVDSYKNVDGSVTTYKYADAQMNREGKGFLGFGKVKASNQLKNLTTENEYEIEPTYLRVNLKRSTVFNFAGDTISTTKQTNGVIDDVAIIAPAMNGKKRYMPIVTTHTSTDKFKNLIQTSATNYDLFPNSITQTTNIGAITTSIVTTYTGPTENTLYLPASITSTRTQGTETDTRTTSYSYVFDAIPNIYRILKTTEITDPTDPNQVVTMINFDTWGHAQKVSVAANGKTRSTSVSYSPLGNNTPSGRFIASKTNDLGETTTYEWNETLGLLNSETTEIDKRKHTTSYKYNNWGQLVETTYPTGMRTANVLQWNTDSSAKYFTYSETSGSAPVWVYYDGLGREVRKETLGLGNKKISVFTEYKPDGKVFRVSEPTFNASAVTWASTYGYDIAFERLNSVATPVGTTSMVVSTDGRTTTVTSPEGKTITTTNTAGQVLTNSVNGKMVSYTYSASGLTKTATPEGGQTMTMDYNLQGKRKYMKDPDAGEVFSNYNGFGELVEEKQKVHNSTDFVITTNNYYDNGLLKNIIRGVGTNTETTTYMYDTKNRVSSVKNSDTKMQEFTYDDFDRVTDVKETIDDRKYNRHTDYDFFGRVKKEVFPSDYYIVSERKPYN
jgi:YD repeat-containing protein